MAVVRFTSRGFLVAALLSMACAPVAHHPVTDAGSRIPQVDSGPADSGPSDSGPSDSGPSDSGPSDSGPADSGPADSGPSDSGPSDSGPADSGPADSGPADSGPADSGPVDAGQLCLTATTCPATGSECIVPTCTNGWCGTTDVAVGTALSTQSPGTCKQQVCDGMGGVTTVTDDANVPASTACVQGTCSTGTPGTAYRTMGTACAEGGGLECNATGVCVGCLSNTDCIGAADWCSTSQTCITPTCSDTMQDGTETDVDCGGSCPPCASNSTCLVDADCVSGACSLLTSPSVCVADQCADGRMDGQETGVDCGGPACDGEGHTCANGGGCGGDADCTSAFCNYAALACYAPACGDGIVSVEKGEQCDLGVANGASGSGCSATCQLLSGQYLNETEPNNTLATANDLAGFAGAVGELVPAGDVDFYTVSVTVPGSSILAAITDGFGHCPFDFASTLTLLGANGAVLASDQGGGVSPCSQILGTQSPAAANLPVGRYGIEVASGSAGIQPYYVLQVTVSPPICGDGILEPSEQCDPGPTPVAGCSATCQLTGNFIPETEPNDTRVLANPLGTHAGFVASINPAGDVDYFSFQVPGPDSLVSIQTSNGVGGCPTGFDSVLTLYDPSGSEIVSDDNGGVGLCSSITPNLYSQAMNLSAGTYYARVDFKGDDATEYEYVVTIAVFNPSCGDGYVEAGEQCDNGPLNGTSDDLCSATCQALAPAEIEPNNVLAEATPPWPGFSFWDGSISPLGDHDYYSFTLAAPGTVTLLTHDVGASGSCSFATELHLDDAAGTELASDLNDGPGPGLAGVGQCSQISKPLSAGTYYAWVQAQRDAELVGEYELGLSIQ